ncbi:DUF2207 domain-containing protein [Actinomadura scrupuli]|uniref:DUF2207 domain-containing protein n=1 Tax=Actinomadura scrupuli TaxID=559629 RepID=UPI003D968B40
MRLPGHIRFGVIVLVTTTAMALAALPSAAATPADPAADLVTEPVTEPATEPAAGPPAGPRKESIPTYDAVLTVRTDGVLHVHETITYDFGDAKGYGIVRTVPYRIDNRLYGIARVRASSSTGASAKVRTAKFMHELRISVGEERKPVGGLQAYVLDYDVTGALTPHGGRDELAWDALGTGWDVPIADAAVRVVSPVPLAGADCAAGRPGETGRCGATRGRRHSVEFTQSGLQPHEGMMIRIALPDGVIRVPPPRYAPAHFRGSAAGSWALIAGLLLVMAVWLARRPAAGRRPVLLGGTILLAAGVVAVSWDLADDILRGGLWEASIGDVALIGVSAAAVGTALVWAARPWSAPGLE